METASINFRLLSVREVEGATAINRRALRRLGRTPVNVDMNVRVVPDLDHSMVSLIVTCSYVAVIGLIRTRVLFVLYGVDVRDRESGGARDYAGRRGDSRRKAYADHARNSGRSAPRCYCRAHSRHPSPLPSAAGDRPDCTDVPTSLRECTVGSYSDVDTEVYSIAGVYKAKTK